MSTGSVLVPGTSSTGSVLVPGTSRYCTSIVYRDLQIPWLVVLPGTGIGRSYGSSNWCKYARYQVQTSGS